MDEWNVYQVGPSHLPLLTRDVHTAQYTLQGAQCELFRLSCGVTDNSFSFSRSSVIFSTQQSMSGLRSEHPLGLCSRSSSFTHPVVGHSIHCRTHNKAKIAFFAHHLISQQHIANGRVPLRFNSTQCHIHSVVETPLLVSSSAARMSEFISSPLVTRFIFTEFTQLG